MLALSLPALTFGLACGVLYSAADAFRKAAPPSSSPQTILFYYVGGQIPVLAGWVLWTGQPPVAAAYALPGFADAALGLCANLLFIVAIRRSAISLMIPLLALVPVLTLLFGGIALGEWPTIWQDLGILLIAIGLFAVFQPSGTRPAWKSALATLRDERGAPAMLGVVVLWSATPALDKVCLGYASPAMHGLIQVSVIWLALLAWAFVRGLSPLRAGTQGARPIAAAAVAGGLGYACQLLAYSLAMVALVEVLKRAVGLFGSLVVGAVFFREPVNTLRIIGMAVIAVGLPLAMIA